jgi:hypothetical protein
MKTVSPTRYRPTVDALEDRFLPTVTVSYDAGVRRLAFYDNADQRTGEPANTIHIYNTGAGHITGDATDAGAFDFFNVDFVSIARGHYAVSYFQQSDAFNSSGDQVKPLLFSGDINGTFVADLQGHAVRAELAFDVQGFSDNGSRSTISFKATGVDIARGAALKVFAGFTGSGNNTFAMDYSGFNAGTLIARIDDGGSTGQDVLSLDATFLDAASARAIVLKGHTPGTSIRPFHGAAPGDLKLVGGQGDDSFRMVLFGPDGLPLSGDVYGGAGVNSCFHTTNVRTHNIQQDIFPIGKQRRTPTVFQFR